MSAAEMLAALREKLAQYDELDKESDQLAQEEKTLASYVRNMMDSRAVGSGPLARAAQKAVSYYEEACGNSDESDFELSDAEDSPRKKAKTTKAGGTVRRGRPPKARPAAPHGDDAPAPTDDDAPALTDDDAASTGLAPSDGRSGPDDSDVAGPEPTGRASHSEPPKASNPAVSAADSDSDGYNGETEAPSDSDDDPDYGGDRVVVDIVSNQSGKSAKPKGTTAKGAQAKGATSRSANNKGTTAKAAAAKASA
ncbi:hypothetical protein LPJ61_006464, partial [Coemansia biformis]